MNIIFGVFIVLILISVTRSILQAVYLWQFREYRIDRMLDYIRIPEGQRMFISKVNSIYFGLAALFTIMLLATRNGTIDAYEFVLIFSIIPPLGDVILITTKLFLKKNIFTPKKSLKSLVITSSTLITVLIAMSILSIDFIVTNQLKQSTVITILLILPLLPIWISGLYLALFKIPENILRYKISLDARKKRNSMTNLQMVAISGSYGKSTTKEYLVHILTQSSSKNIEFTAKFNNTTLGVFRKFLAIPEDTDIFVAEIGSYKKGDGSEICEYITPTHCVITGLNEQHLPLFGSIENITRAETECTDFLPDTGVIVKTIDNDLISTAQIPHVETYTVSKVKDEATTQLLSYQFDYPLSTVSFNLNGTVFTTTTNALSKGNVENALLALTAAMSLGIQPNKAIDSLKTLPLPDKTLTIHEKEGHISIDDSHNANSTGVMNALDLVAEFNRPAIIVLSDILELGKQTKEIHQAVAQRIVEIKPVLVIYAGLNYGKGVQKALNAYGYTGTFILSPGRPNSSSLEHIHTYKKQHSNTVTLLEGYYARNWLES
jgi:UDP-N-acetylmuramoyl-tripeptide--D-alanyl-D-alanine ligase